VAEPGNSEQPVELTEHLREVLAPWPRADDAVAVASERAANACAHSRSGVPGGVFTVRAEVSEGHCLYVAVEDDGGSWDPAARTVLPQHGLDLVQAIAGSANWGVSGGYTGRVVWARLHWPGAGQLDTPSCPPDELLAPDLTALALMRKDWPG
jgi:serine/threonine-protein kinase RsbW